MRRVAHEHVGRRALTVPRILVLASILISSLLTAEVAGQEREASRVALVIGNSAYPDAPLRNPVNDARLVGAALRAVGFGVTTVTDADKAALEDALVEFSDRVAEAKEDGAAGIASSPRCARAARWIASTRRG